LSASIVPYRRRSQVRNASAEVSHQQREMWQPYSLLTCQSARRVAGVPRGQLGDQRGGGPAVLR
jgi:hypothetical protein